MIGELVIGWWVFWLVDRLDEGLTDWYLLIGRFHMVSQLLNSGLTKTHPFFRRSLFGALLRQETLLSQATSCPGPCMYCVQQWPMFKHPQKQNTKTHQKPVLACLGAIPETQSPETPDLLRPTHEIAFETHSTLTSPKTVFCPASRSGLVADCSWLFPWAACLNISSMSWIEERHGREELETSSQDCPHQDGDRKHRELKHILFWISDAAFASFSKLATSIGYFMLFSCNCQENVWSWRFPLRVENRSNVSHSGRSFTAESRIGQFLIITSCNWVWPWS